MDDLDCVADLGDRGRSPLAMQDLSPTELSSQASLPVFLLTAMIAGAQRGMCT
jgi:hypothetical protein